MVTAAGAVVLAATSLAACSVSSDDEDASSTTSPTVAGETADQDTSDTSASDDTTGGGEESASDGDAVVLGVAAADLERIAAFGIDVDPLDLGAMYQAWVDEQNEAGGVAGRPIELAYRAFIPLLEPEVQASCVELTEDADAFAVIGIYLNDSTLCVPETHETPYIGLWGLTAERAERAVAPFLALEMAEDRQRVAGIRVLADEGLLDGTVGLYWQADDDATVDAAVRPLLGELGIEPATEVRLDDFGDDQTATDQALDAIVERLRSDGVEVVLNVSDVASLLSAFQRKGWLPSQVLSTSQQALSEELTEGTGLQPETLGAMEVAAPYAPTKDELLADPDVTACIDTYNASGPEAPVDPEALSDDSLVSIAGYCAAFRLFVAAADAAEGELTAESFGAGAASLGELTLPGVVAGSLGEAKFDVGDAIGRYRYDPATNTMVPVGEPIVVGE
ncbi:MAG: ABC transporter substrate-binding protein [Actinomycetota bacterium]|nr:ABC transporter substrate-binding protein [Actinomycetota bacterium]